MKLISFHFKLLSHTPDRLLYEHLKNVGKISRNIILSKFIPHKETLAEISYLIGIAHDFGKAMPYFQKKLIMNENTILANHSLISAIFGYYVVKNYLKRREVPMEFNFPIMTYLVIARHHSDLRDILGVNGELEILKEKENYLKKQLENLRENLEEIKEIYFSLCRGYLECDIDEFLDNFDSIIKEIIRKLHNIGRGNVKNYLILMLLYSVLLDADKMDASGTETPEKYTIPSNIVDEYKSIKFGKGFDKIGEIRDDIYREIISFHKVFDPEKNRIMYLELPTGSGKTLSAFSLALKLRDRIKNEYKIAPKIIYSLPFLSIIDQNAYVLEEVLAKIVGIEWKDILSMDPKERKNILEKSIPSNLLLIHHHLADVVYTTEEENYDVDQSRILIEGWKSEVIVTTFFQLLHSMITNRNVSARRFHNIVNSIIILDEVQNIPVKYWPLVREILKGMAEYFGSWIIFMTATMPLIFRKDEVTEIIEDSRVSDYYKSFNRVKYCRIDEEMHINDVRDWILKLLNDEEDGDILVIVNKVSAAKRIYEMIRGVYDSGIVNRFGVYTDPKNMIKIINLTTHIIPHHRFQRIYEIKKNDGYRKVIISTQLVEAGVDISTKIVLRDISPMDSVFQSGGRCNRSYELGELGGKVYVATLRDDRSRLYRNIYDSVLIDITDKILERHPSFEEREIREINKEYYEHVVRREATDDEILVGIMKYRFSELNKFRLIEEKYPKVDVFVEIDENAREIFERYLEIREISDRIERKNEFLKIKKQFYNYVISVSRDIVDRLGIPLIGEIYFIDYQSIGVAYDVETGIRDSEISFII